MKIMRTENESAIEKSKAGEGNSGALEVSFSLQYNGRENFR